MVVVKMEGCFLHKQCTASTPQAMVQCYLANVTKANGLDPAASLLFPVLWLGCHQLRKKVATSEGSLFSLRLKLIICFLPVHSTRDVNYSSEWCLTKCSKHVTLNSVNEYYYPLKILTSAITH